MSVTAWVVLSLVADLFVPSALIGRNNAVETTRVFKTKLAAAHTRLEIIPFESDEIGYRSVSV